MKISHKNGRGSKIHIYTDGEYAITTDVNCWLDNYISPDTDISEDEWENFVTAVNYKKALNKCADILSRRDYSVYEVKQKLLKTVDEASAEKALSRYIEAGYLDDERYCRSLTEYLYSVKKFSSYHIKQECYKRGISSEIIGIVLDDFEFDNVDTITELLRTKYAGKLNEENGKAKVCSSLARKGFSYSDIQSAFYRLEDYEN